MTTNPETINLEVTSPFNDPNNLGASTLASAADNAGDINAVRTLSSPSSSTTSTTFHISTNPAWFEDISQPPFLEANSSMKWKKSTSDNAPSADVVTGTGDSLPAEVDSKRLQNFTNPDLSKGHGRYDKHVVAKDG